MVLSFKNKFINPKPVYCNSWYRHCMKHINFSELKKYFIIFLLAVFVVIIAEMSALVFLAEKLPAQTDALLANNRVKLQKNVYDADKKGSLCVSIGAHVSSERSVNVGLERVSSLARVLHLPATNEWVQEVSIATRGHAWLNIYSGENRIQTVGLWPGGIFLDRERGEPPGGWIVRCIAPGEGGKLLKAIERKNNVTWTGYYNCASFVADVWNEVFPDDPVTSQPVRLTRIDDFSDVPFTRLVPLPPSPWGIIQTSIERTKARAEKRNVY